MLRGELSNRPARICGVDYRILLDERRPYSWFVKYVPELLTHKSFETRMKNALPFRPGAKMWLEANCESRIFGVTVGVPLLARAVDMIIGSHVAEVVHLGNAQEYRYWVRSTPQVYKVLTKDPALIGLHDVTTLFTSWSERV